MNLAPGDEGYIDPGGWEGPLHQKYAGQVVFSSAPIAKDAKDDSTVVTSNNLGDVLYGRFWAKESQHNLLPRCETPRHVLRYEINGAKAGKPASHLDSFALVKLDEPKTRSMASLTFDPEKPLTAHTVWQSSGKKDHDSSSRFWTTAIVSQLKEGENTIRIVVTLDCDSSNSDDPIVAEGKLTVNVAPGSKAKYYQKFGMDLPPSKHPENDKLAPRIKQLVDDMPDWDNEEVIAARVTSSEWEPIRNDLTGVLTHYYVDAAVIVHLKKETNPDVCRVFPIGVKRDVAGGNLIWAGNGSGEPFVCSNAPK